jgi:hypothetical protein
MWKILIAFPKTVDIYFFRVFGQFIHLKEMSGVKLCEMNQVHFEDFGSFMAEDLSKFRFVEITYATASIKAVELYRSLQTQNKMKFKEVSFYVLSYSIPLHFEQFESFEKDLLDEFDCTEHCLTLSNTA